MGQLRNANAQDRSSFPGSDFAASDAVPTTQCETSPIFSTNAITITPGFRLTDVGKFIGLNFRGDTCHITASVGGNTGQFEIDVNNDDTLFLLQDPGNGDPVAYHLQNSVPQLPSGVDATTVTPLKALIDTGNFGGAPYTGRICRITASPTGNTGDFLIISNTPDQLNFDSDPGTSIEVAYFIISSLNLSNIQTVNEIMLAAQAAGAATMMKGGQLFIDGILTDMSAACPITLNPA